MLCTTLSRANERRNWQIFADFGNYLIKLIRPLYSDCPLPNIDLENEIFALDSTTDKQCRCIFCHADKETMRYSVVEQNFNIDQTTGLRADKTVELIIAKSKRPVNLRNHADLESVNFCKNRFARPHHRTAQQNSSQ